MPLLSRVERRDPWWGWDGAAVQATRRRRRAISRLAFTASLAALGGAAAAWAIYLGLAATVGIRATLGIG